MQRTLTEDELQGAWERWSQTRDQSVRAKLVEYYLPLVRYVAKQLRPQVSSYLQPELFSLGLIGLLDALDKFDLSRGYRFETYGVPRIRGAMRDGVRKMESLPRGARERPGCLIQSVSPVDFQSVSASRWQDCLADSGQLSALDKLELRADHDEVLEAVEALPERERQVIRRYYYEGRYLKAIGDELGVTESRICQIHRGSLKMLEQILLRVRAA